MVNDYDHMTINTFDYYLVMANLLHDYAFRTTHAILRLEEHIITTLKHTCVSAPTHFYDLKLCLCLINGIQVIHGRYSVQWHLRAVFDYASNSTCLLVNFIITCSSKQ